MKTGKRLKGTGAVKDTSGLEKLSRLLRYYIMISTTEAGSGHPTSALSAADLMASLLFGGVFRFYPDNPAHPNNDRLIFSKGHASPLLYALWAAAGKVSEKELLTYRKFGSPFEGHPSMEFKYTEAPTGSLGQGLSIGVGMALNAKYLDKLPYRTYVLLGDSEMSEGSQWESIQIAAHYKLDNLVGIVDINRLGQRGQTMYGHDISAYEKRISAFGWETMAIDGHSMPEVLEAYERALSVTDRPVMILARTIKGKGVSMLEDKEGWHGKAIGKDDLPQALADIGEVEKGLTGSIARPVDLLAEVQVPGRIEEPSYPPDKPVATREAYGAALRRIYPAYPQMVVLDAEVSNSTKSEKFKAEYPERFFEMYIAEQNMAGTALGLARRGKKPFVSTFSAFLTRAFDQIRMSQYANPDITFCGSHAGVSIGQDGPSQMGLEDIAMFRSLQNSVILCPSDAYSGERMVEEAARHGGMVYIRTARGKTPILYSADDRFPIGGSMVLRKSEKDVATVAAAGITVHEALKAYEELERQGIIVRVIDLYSIKPIDHAALHEAASQTRAIITVEDHSEGGGLGDAVRAAMVGITTNIYTLAVRKMPKSGKPGELLDYEEISGAAIAEEIREVL